jgi:cell division septation protein DedD
VDSSQDTEITLGTTKLLGLFFGLVIVCAVFFALGYTLGRKSDIGLAATGTAPQTAVSNSPKPAGASAQPAAPMTFYKAVEQKDANAQLTPTSANSETTSPTTAAQTPAASTGASSSTPVQPSATAPDPMIAVPTTGYVVQVAAVSKQDDAAALVDALKKKQYPAFIAGSSSTDKLFHVQVGPFTDFKDAEGMRTRLINDGYNPILKK